MGQLYLMLAIAIIGFVGYVVENTVNTIGDSVIFKTLCAWVLIAWGAVLLALDWALSISPLLLCALIVYRYSRKHLVVLMRDPAGDTIKEWVWDTTAEVRDYWKQQRINTEVEVNIRPLLFPLQLSLMYVYFRYFA